MNVVGKFGSLISQGVYSVATPFHPFGGAVDIIVVQQQDGSFRSTPWYVRFGKFQGVLKGAEKIVRISVNGSEANFHMYLDNSGEAYFVREADPESGSVNAAGDIVRESGSPDVRNNYSNYAGRINNVAGHRLEHSASDTGPVQSRDEFNLSGLGRIDRSESDVDRRFYDFPEDESFQEDSVELSEYGSNHFENLDGDQPVESSPNSEVVLVSVDGHILMAPISASEQNNENVQLNTPQFHLGPAEGAEFCEENEGFDSVGNDWDGNYIREMNVSSSVIVMSATRNDTNGSSGHLLEVCKGDGQHECHQDAIIQIGEPLNCDSEDATACIKREEVFKSCLELQELVNHYDASVDTESINSPAGIQNPREKFAQTAPAVDEAGPISNCIEINNVNDVSSSQSLGNSTSIQNDAVDPIHEDSIGTGNMVSLKVSDRSDGFQEAEDGHTSTMVATETTSESQDKTEPEVKSGMSETMEEPEATAVSEAIEDHTSTSEGIELARIIMMDLYVCFFIFVETFLGVNFMSMTSLKPVYCF